MNASRTVHLTIRAARGAVQVFNARFAFVRVEYPLFGAPPTIRYGQSVISPPDGDYRRLLAKALFCAPLAAGYRAVVEG